MPKFILSLAFNKHVKRKMELEAKDKAEVIRIIEDRWIFGERNAQRIKIERKI